MACGEVIVCAKALRVQASSLNDPERAAQLGKQAAIDSQGRLSPETVAARTVNCYGKAIERSRSRK